MDAKKFGVVKDLDDYSTAEGAGAGAAVNDKKDPPKKDSGDEEYEIEELKGKKCQNGIVSIDRLFTNILFHMYSLFRYTISSSGRANPKIR